MALSLIPSRTPSPTKSRRRNAQGCKGVPRIVLAVAERALAVLPGFRQWIDERPARKEPRETARTARSTPARRGSPAVESVLLGCVVIHGGDVAEPIDRR